MNPWADMLFRSSNPSHPCRCAEWRPGAPCCRERGAEAEGAAVLAMVGPVAILADETGALRIEGAA